MYFSKRFTGCYRDCVVISNVVIYDSRDFMSCNHMTMCFLCLRVCSVVSISQKKGTSATPECNASCYWETNLYTSVLLYCIFNIYISSMINHLRWWWWRVCISATVKHLKQSLETVTWRGAGLFSNLEWWVWLYPTGSEPYLWVSPSGPDDWVPVHLGWGLWFAHVFQASD